MTLQLSIPSTQVIGSPTSGAMFVVDDAIAMVRTGIANVVFIGRAGAPSGEWILVDCGIRGYADAILDAANERFGAGSVPAAIVQTHGHFDHVGSLEFLADHWDCAVLAHQDEHPFLDGQQSYPPADPTAGGGLMTLLSPLFPRSPVDVSLHLRPLASDGTVANLQGWQWLHTPGHTPGHISLWHAARQALIAGDACITTGQESAYEALVQTPELHGPPRYFTPDWDTARRSVGLLAQLPVRTLVTGHGPPLHGDDVSSRLAELARRFDEVARPKNQGD